jgi:hypothetical protein
MFKRLSPWLVMVFVTLYGVMAFAADNKVVVVPLSSAQAIPQPVVFKVKGTGFAVKNINANTTVEVNIWDNKLIDTHNAFNMITKRFVVPETGYYYLHAVVDQANTPTGALFSIYFNLDNNLPQFVEGSFPSSEVSGIFSLTEGQEVYVRLRNYSTTESEMIDGAWSWFEGYKIR